MYRISWKPREGEISSARGAQKRLWLSHFCVPLYKNKIQNDFYMSRKDKDLTKSGWTSVAGESHVHSLGSAAN